MKNELYLSMGSLVERRNDFDADEVARTVPALTSDGIIDGAEFMFIRFYYGRAAELARRLLSEGCVFPTFHTDKDIGSILSDAGVSSENDAKEASRLKERALDMFKYNCETAAEAGSRRLVLHLWGGESSDRAISFNISCLDELEETASGFGLRIMVENVPSVVTDPLYNWRMMSSHFGNVGLVFDTRFATCHRQPKETLEDASVLRHIEHVHVSDYRGGLKEFSHLRPVFHPGEGVADFPLIFSLLKNADYSGSFTLESPGIIDEGPAIDRENLKRSLSFIRNSMG